MKKTSKSVTPETKPVFILFYCPRHNAYAFAPHLSAARETFSRLGTLAKNDPVVTVPAEDSQIAMQAAGWYPLFYVPQEYKEEYEFIGESRPLGLDHMFRFATIPDSYMDAMFGDKRSEYEAFLAEKYRPKQPKKSDDNVIIVDPEPPVTSKPVYWLYHGLVTNSYAFAPDHLAAIEILGPLDGYENTVEATIPEALELLQSGNYLIYIPADLLPLHPASSTFETRIDVLLYYATLPPEYLAALDADTDNTWKEAVKIAGEKSGHPASDEPDPEPELKVYRIYYNIHWNPEFTGHVDLDHWHVRANNPRQATAAFIAQHDDENFAICGIAVIKPDQWFETTPIESVPSADDVLSNMVGMIEDFFASMVPSESSNQPSRPDREEIHTDDVTIVRAAWSFAYLWTRDGDEGLQRMATGLHNIIQHSMRFSMLHNEPLSPTLAYDDDMYTSARDLANLVSFIGGSDNAVFTLYDLQQTAETYFSDIKTL